MLQVKAEDQPTLPNEEVDRMPDKAVSGVKRTHSGDVPPDPSTSSPLLHGAIAKPQSPSSGQDSAARVQIKQEAPPPANSAAPIWVQASSAGVNRSPKRVKTEPVWTTRA